MDSASGGGDGRRRGRKGRGRHGRRKQQHQSGNRRAHGGSQRIEAVEGAHGAGDALKVHIHDGGHVFDEPLQLQASSFLGRWLSARQSQQAASR